MEVIPDPLLTSSPEGSPRQKILQKARRRFSSLLDKNRGSARPLRRLGKKTRPSIDHVGDLLNGESFHSHLSGESFHSQEASSFKVGEIDELFPMYVVSLQTALSFTGATEELGELS